MIHAGIVARCYATSHTQPEHNGHADLRVMLQAV